MIIEMQQQIEKKQASHQVSYLQKPASKTQRKKLAQKGEQV
jgi:hypothetical protein